MPARSLNLYSLSVMLPAVRLCLCINKYFKGIDFIMVPSLGLQPTEEMGQFWYRLGFGWLLGSGGGGGGGMLTQWYKKIFQIGLLKPAALWHKNDTWLLSTSY